MDYKWTCQSAAVFDVCIFSYQLNFTRAICPAALFVIGGLPEMKWLHLQNGKGWAKDHAVSHLLLPTILLTGNSLREYWWRFKFKLWLREVGCMSSSCPLSYLVIQGACLFISVLMQGLWRIAHTVSCFSASEYLWFVHTTKKSPVYTGVIERRHYIKLNEMRLGYFSLGIYGQFYFQLYSNRKIILLGWSSCQLNNKAIVILGSGVCILFHFHSTVLSVQHPWLHLSVSTVTNKELNSNKQTRRRMRVLVRILS